MGDAFDVDPTSSEWVDGLFFAVSHWDDTAEMFQLVGGPFDPFSGITGPIESLGGGSYRLTAGLDYDMRSWDSGAIVGKLSDNEIIWPDSPTSHFAVYDDYSVDAFEVGIGSLTDDYTSLANVEGCEACHGTPYRKHGNVQASVPGAPDFTYCKSCHYDDRPGGHEDWQYMVDDPENWANLVDPAPRAADYAYTANVMNATHMSHALEFPYPQSISNCVTCHAGNITEVLDDSNFDLEFCKSCHVTVGTDAWPELDDGTDAEIYAQERRPPPMTFLWTNAGVDSFHNVGMVCGSCHGEDGFSAFSDMHSGYDKTIYDANGVRFSDTYTVAVDNVTLAGNLITVDFSSNNVDVAPTLAISFYGWDSKHFIVAAHERDGNDIDCPHNSRPGCNIEWSPGSTKPFFTEEAGSVAGAWSVTFDMSLYQAYKTDSIPQLITDGVVKFAEIAVLPVLDIGADRVNLLAVSTSFDLGAMALVDGYYQQGVTSPVGKGTTVDFGQCVACHDNLSSIVHTGRGRYGDSMQTCKACHATTFPGSHLEQQSRSIDSYVHSIHMFQPMDEDDVYNYRGYGADNDPDFDNGTTDPVFDARNEMHKHHTLPYFTAMACEACHVNGTYNAPDQSKSMPGAQSSSWDITDPNARAIGTIPEYVTGPGSRACGSCHRADMIVHDDAGGLATFNAHTDAFGTLEENDPDDLVLYGIIDKIMSMFE
jgi:OmcA/MtrC family decaheme c-type cytochrome